MKREGPSSPLGRDLFISPTIIQNKKRRATHREEEERATQKKKKERARTAHYAGVTFRSIYLVEGLKDSKAGMVARIYTKAASTSIPSMEA